MGRGGYIIMSKIRESNMELLRIFAMLLVVISHFFVHGDWPYSRELTINNIIISSLTVGEIGVTAFVLISGYFLINQPFKIEKLAKLVFQMWFYGATILLIAYVFDTNVITKKYIFGSLMPFYSLNWFAKAYLLLYVISPIINKVLRRCTRETLFIALLIFGLYWNVFRAFTFYEHGNIKLTVIYIYCIGAYFRMYGNRYFDSIKRALSLSIISYALIVISVIVLWYLSLENSFYLGKQSRFLALSSVLVLSCGIGIFYSFKNIIICNTKINNVAKTMFGVYLIHDNPLISNWLWNEFINVASYYNSCYIALVALGCSAAVMATCSIIE